MKTIKLEVNNNIYDKLIWLLKQFNSEDLKIETEKDASIKKYLQNQLKELDSESAEFLSMEELDIKLEKTISKYED